MAEAQLVFAALGSEQTDEWISAAAGWLTAEELTRAEHLSPDARARHMVGRAVLRLLAAEGIGTAQPQAVIVAETAEGKPFLPEAPDLRVSVAHSDGSVVVAAFRRADIGVDVDSLGRFTPDVHRLAARVFAPDESARLAKLEPAAAGVEFMRHWIVKEAVGKALGTGYVPALRGAEIEPEPTRGASAGRVRLRSVWAGPAPEDWTLHCVELPDGDELVVVAIAAPEATLAPPLRVTCTDVQSGRLLRR
jgi:phosphopantetheinyl transferase